MRAERKESREEKACACVFVCEREENERGKAGREREREQEREEARKEKLKLLTCSCTRGSMPTKKKLNFFLQSWQNWTLVPIRENLLRVSRGKTHFCSLYILL